MKGVWVFSCVSFYALYNVLVSWGGDFGKGKRMKGKTFLVLVIVTLNLITTANSSEWQLVEKIQLSNVDILDITSDGTNFIVLSNGDMTDSVSVHSTSGEFIKFFYTWTRYTSGIAWNGRKAVFSSGSSSDSKQLYEMELRMGGISGPYTEPLGTVLGLGCDGIKIFVTEGGGDWYFLDAFTYSYLGTPQYFNPEAGSFVPLSWWTGPTYGPDFYDGNLYIASTYEDIKAYSLQSFNQAELVDEIQIDVDWPQGITFMGDDLYIAERHSSLVYHYEFQPKQADFTNDGVVDINDFSVLSSSWNTCPDDENWYVLCDLWKDDEIDIFDLVVFVEDWLWGANQTL